jgi:hypothetical protein
MLLLLNKFLLQTDKKLTDKKIGNDLVIIKKLRKAAKSSGFRVSEVVEYL